MSNKEYTADDIKILKGIEAVRKRPAMYIGDTSIYGLHHLVYEVVDNSIDEATAGHCKNINVIINVDNSVTVEDDGRGIPVEQHKEGKKPAVEIILTTLHAGGKFDNNSYKVSGGLHGVGVSCVNALSEWLEVEVYRNGHAYHQRYERGEKKTELEKRGRVMSTGTRIIFKPDDEIFETLEFKYETLANRIRDLAFLNSGVCITLEDERTDKKETFKYDGGLKEFIEYINSGKDPIHKDVIYFEKADGDVIIEIALQYHNGYNETTFSYANNINTIEGGTHLSGFKSAITRSFNAYAKKNKLLKDNMSLSGEDMREGMSSVVSVKLPNPQFEGQTKTKLGNRDIQGIMESNVNDFLNVYLEENPSTAKNIIKKAIQTVMARQAAKRARDLTRRKGVLSSGNLPGKLADCSSKDVESTELFVVEGDSAGGSAKQGRDRRFQAILPLKGKILNVEKARINKMLNHEEISILISAIGTSIGEEFNLEKLRYGKIIIMTDADIDGSHIRTLLLTFLFRHMNQLITNGNVYIAQPPLFKVKGRRREEYVFDENAMQRSLIQNGIDGTVLKIGDREIQNSDLEEIIKLLEKLERLGTGIRKKGIAFDQFLQARVKDKGLPVYSLLVNNSEKKFLYSDEEVDAFIQEYEKESGEEITISHYGDMDKEQKDIEITEFVEAAELEKNIAKLENWNITMDKYFASPGAVNPAGVLTNGTMVETVKSYSEITPAIRNIGQKGIDIQRYKGLGEMNPQQLWETTMNPETRTILRVELEDAAKADNMFSVLMGEVVETRRKFIEQNALFIKDLDV